jgi:carbamoyl-phosphate synthase small subunit
MLYHKRIPAVLLFEDGTRFDGFAVGKIGTSGGEICFNTGMTGYQEIYTDPSYYGQIVVNTNSHIGNYGATAFETESKNVMIKGLVVRNFSQIYSRSTAEKSLQEYLESAGIVGISDVDTRSIVRHIRKAGVMNAVISSEETASEKLQDFLHKVPNMSGLELSTFVSTNKVYEDGNVNAKYRVAVLDLGIKRSILKNFTDRNCLCKVFPAKTSYEEMKAWAADGFFISNGPGDPAAMPYAVETVCKILEKNEPVFGICLGHQILAHASGVGTYKMHNGHRGLNHPVKNLETGHCEITSQNHGFAVKREDLLGTENLKETHIHLNDGTVAGFRRLDKPAFSVQYHPESSPGPHDSTYLFDKFIRLMSEK